MEHRVGKYIVDVAFYEKDELVMVVEVKHKHAVDGENVNGLRIKILFILKCRLHFTTKK